VVGTARAASSTVSNVLPRTDAATGQTLDIHDGNTIRIKDTFFWYGAGYGFCVEQATGCTSVAVGECGFNLNHTVNLATSTDFNTWTLYPNVLVSHPVGVLFSPWVVQSKSTGKWVMWYNLLPVANGWPNFLHACYCIAVADSPYGPFETVVTNVSGVAYRYLPDAPAVFVDDDGSAYLAFTHEKSHINHVQRLTPDLMQPVPKAVSKQIGPGNNEGIFMFKRNHIYYIGFGVCCCFCGSGTNVDLYASSNPLGPYKLLGTVVTPTQWGAQTGSIFFTGQEYVLYGDRWQSAPDKIKAHDFSYMAPLQFKADGSVVPLQWSDNVTISY